jgi:hypothetical protein
MYGMNRQFLIRVVDFVLKPQLLLASHHPWLLALPRTTAAMDPSTATTSSVPDVPGTLIEEAHQQSLRGKVMRICGLNNTRFPGAQPVSFTTDSLQMLKEEE